jgi:thioesterase domain-containing protein
VESIVLLDVPAPLEYGSIDDKQLISWFFMDLIGDGAIPHEGYVAQLGGVDELLSSFLVAAQSSGKLSEDLSVIDLVPLFRVFAANLRALRAYRPVKLSESVRVLNMKAQMLPPHQLMDHPGKDKMDWGWGVYLPKSVKTISIPGDHYTIIKSPHVNNVARCINDFLYGENEVTVG